MFVNTGKIFLMKSDKCFDSILQSPDFLPNQTSSYFLWPVENSPTVAFAEGQFCLECWARPHSYDRPLAWSFARKEQSHVFGPWWEKHPLECDFEGIVWDQQEGLPFLSKRASPPEAVGRSEVRCTQCPLSLQHTKPTADYPNPLGLR